MTLNNDNSAEPQLHMESVLKAQIYILQAQRLLAVQGEGSGSPKLELESIPRTKKGRKANFSWWVVQTLHLLLISSLIAWVTSGNCLAGADDPVQNGGSKSHSIRNDHGKNENPPREITRLNKILQWSITAKSFFTFKKLDDLFRVERWIANLETTQVYSCYKLILRFHEAIWFKSRQGFLKYSSET